MSTKSDLEHYRKQMSWSRGDPDKTQSMIFRYKLDIDALQNQIRILRRRIRAAKLQLKREEKEKEKHEAC